LQATGSTHLAKNATAEFAVLKVLLRATCHTVESVASSRHWKRSLALVPPRKKPPDKNSRACTCCDAADWKCTLCSSTYTVVAGVCEGPACSAAGAGGGADTDGWAGVPSAAMQKEANSSGDLVSKTFVSMLCWSELLFFVRCS